MAFIKRCVATVMKCFLCGKPGIYKFKENWFCQECPTSQMDQKDKKQERISLKSKDDKS
jgi:hypothetical protein